MLTDTHCHVLKEYYDDKKSILDNAKEHGVLRIINASYNMASSLEVMKDVKKYDNVYGVVGLHPENCLEEFDYKIAVDKGMEFCRKNGIWPDEILGDFDSVDPEVKNYFDSQDIPVHVYKPE